MRPRLVGLRLSVTREAEILEELSQHLDQRYGELRAGGVGDAEARLLALAELPDPEALARDMRRLRQAQAPPAITPGAPSGSVLSDLWQDVRYALRMLRKQPGFAAVAVLTLALGIGANTAIFGLVNATLFARLPVTDRERLTYVYRFRAGGPLPYPLYASLRDESQSFEGLAAWSGFAASLNAAGTNDLTLGYLVSGNFFEVLGVTASRGRLFSTADDVSPGKAPLAVISDELWHTRFGGRPDIVGQDIHLNGHLFTILGVTPAQFPGPLVGVRRHVYVPMMMQPIVRPPRQAAGDQNASMLDNRQAGWLFGVGRLKPGIPPEQARSELNLLDATYRRTMDPAGAASPANAPDTMTVLPIDEGNPAQRRQMRSVAVLLGGIVGAVLLIACANIANLLLSRTASRQRELAIRLALGAKRSRLIRQLLTESTMLALIGGMFGLGLAWATVRLFQATPPPPGALPVAIDFAIDWRVLWFTLGVSCVTGIVFGIAPALRTSRPTLVPALKGGSITGDEGSHRFELKKVLVVAEVALSLLLLIAAGLFVRSLQAAQSIRVGFDADRLISAPLGIHLLRYSTPQGREFYRQIVDRVTRLPGVEAASLARVPIMAGDGRVVGLMVEGRRDYPDGLVFSEGFDVWTTEPSRLNQNIIGPKFFETLGIPLVLGRSFTDQDSDGRLPVVVVNETMVKMHFPGANPIGQRVSFSGSRGPWREIVGVVRDSKYRTLDEPALPVVYVPLAQEYQPNMTLYVRTALPPGALVAEVRREILAMESNLPVADIQRMSDTIATSLYAARMGAWLLGLFGGLALALAAIGTYGVLAFSVARRTREIGIRLALGAAPRHVFLLVVRDGMLLVCVGIVIGLAAGLAGARSLARFLYGVPTADAATFLAMTVMLLTIALAACAIPARRAMRVSPIAALRYE